MSYDARNIDITNLSIQASTVAEVLNEHGVFGAVDIDIEARDFVRMVEAHALSEDHNSLEITYRTTGVRLLVRSRVMNRMALIMRIQVIPHPYDNPKISCPKIAEDIDSRILALDLTAK